MALFSCGRHTHTRRPTARQRQISKVAVQQTFVLKKEQFNSFEKKNQWFKILAFGFGWRFLISLWQNSLKAISVCVWRSSMRMPEKSERVDSFLQEIAACEKRRMPSQFHLFIFQIQISLVEWKTWQNRIFRSLPSILLSQRVKQGKKNWTHLNKKKKKQQEQSDDSNQKYLNDGIFIRRNENISTTNVPSECRSFSNLRHTKSKERRNWIVVGVIVEKMNFVCSLSVKKPQIK